MGPWQPSPACRDFARELLARSAFPGRGPWDLAVSGGPDSLAMTLLAHRAWYDGQAERPVVWTVDHGLRDESSADARFVVDLGAQLGVVVHVRAARVAPGANVEDRARAARRAVLPAGALRAHSADDQAETVLLALGRGTGIAGARGIDSRTAPLLGLRRVELARLCELSGFPPRHDSMNHDRRFARVAIRTDVLPQFSAAMGRDVVPLLARFARLAGELGEIVEIDEIVDDERAALAPQTTRIGAAQLREWRASPAAVLARRVRAFCSPARRIDFATTQRVVAVVNGSRRACQIGGGWTVRRARGSLELVRDVPAAADSLS